MTSPLSKGETDRRDIYHDNACIAPGLHIAVTG